MIQSINSLRAIFAILIFLHHSPLNIDGVLDFAGSLSVCFFMVLSGFALSMGYGRKVENDTFSYKNYLSKRVVRIYPLHILCFVPFLFYAVYEGVGWVSLLGKSFLNVMFLQSYVPYRGVYFSFNAPSWYLCDLMLFYLLFPYLYRRMGDSIIRNVMLIAVLTLVMLLLNIVIPEQYCQDILYINPLCRLPDFMIGMFLYKIYHQYKASVPQLSFGTLSFVEIMLMLLLIVTVALSIPLGEKYQLAVIWWLPVCFLLLVISLYDSTGGVVCRLLHCSWLQKLGELSFTIYMTHFFFLQVLLPHFFVSETIGAAWSVTSMTFLVVLFVSFLVHRYFESLFRIK